MNNEEKKAIENFNNYINAIDTFGTIDPKCCNNLYKSTQIILNLIKNQQKEIEEYKLLDANIEQANKIIQKNKKWKDKIKAKIEELRQEIKDYCYVYECNKGCLDKCKEDCEYYMFIEILQSLLDEKE